MTRLLSCIATLAVLWMPHHGILDRSIRSVHPAAAPISAGLLELL